MMTLLFGFASYASDLPKELPGEVVYVTPQKLEIPIIQKQAIKPRLTKGELADGNIPSEYLTAYSRQSTASELIQPPKGSFEILRALKIGDSIEAQVEHSIIAFPDEKAPVVATIGDGNLRGLKLIGESYLEPNSKRIFVSFQKVVIGNQVYQTKASGVSALGQPGLIGEYHSREAEYFTGDFIASFAAGYFDGLVPRHTNAFGQIETDPTVDSAVKKGLASGALSTAERFREKLKKVPEFSELKGPFNLKILILDQVKTTN